MGRKLTFKELEQRVKELEIKLDASRKVDPFTVWQRFKGNLRAYGIITPDNLQSQKKHPKKVWIREQENKSQISPLVNLLNCKNALITQSLKTPRLKLVYFIRII